jgi:hypothetical protein
MYYLGNEFEEIPLDDKAMDPGREEPVPCPLAPPGVEKA